MPKCSICRDEYEFLQDGICDNCKSSFLQSDCIDLGMGS
jgi:predicted amidophosphoribosyltransferase